MTLEAGEVSLKLVRKNGTASVCGMCGPLLELGERAGRVAAEMRDERRGIAGRMILYMTSTDLTYGYIKVAHGDAV